MSYERFKEFVTNSGLVKFSLKFYYRVLGAITDNELYQIIGDKISKVLCNYIPLNLNRMINIYVIEEYDTPNDQFEGRMDDEMYDRSMDDGLNDMIDVGVDIRDGFNVGIHLDVDVGDCYKAP